MTGWPGSPTNTPLGPPPWPAGTPWPATEPTAESAGQDDPTAVTRIPSGGRWLRLALWLATAGLCADSWFLRGTGPVLAQVLITVVIASATARWPGGPVPLGVLGLALVVRMWHGHAVLDANLWILLVLIPLVHQWAALAAAVPPQAQLRPAALRPSAVRLVISVLVGGTVLTVAGAAGMLPSA